MKLEPGKFYKHESGRSIAVVGEVTTWKWGPMLVIEETDDTGHSISCVEADSADTKGQWIEIGVEEWKREFGILEA
ncbi:MAG: hypothetical protein EOM17_16250 [Synergistales bacterium]|nr:hypothetical protein [Synergistales bacterium]